MLGTFRPYKTVADSQFITTDIFIPKNLVINSFLLCLGSANYFMFI